MFPELLEFPMRLGADTLLTASLRNASPSFLAFKVPPHARPHQAGAGHSVLSEFGLSAACGHCAPGLASAGHVEFAQLSRRSRQRPRSGTESDQTSAWVSASTISWHGQDLE